jgi:hypothetical protein
MATAEIDLKKLKSITLALLDAAIAENEGGCVSISPDDNLYWTVPWERTAITREPPIASDVGNYSDDWSFLQLVSSEPGCANPYNLVHLAPILQLLAHKSLPAK